MKKKILAATAALLLAAGLGGVVEAAPAAAQATGWHTYSGYCKTPNGFQFVSSVDVYFDGNMTYVNASKRIGYYNPGWLGLEYRYRVFNGSTVIWDTGYRQENINTWTNSAQEAYGGSNLRIEMDAGRIGDGYATCAMNFYPNN